MQAMQRGGPLTFKQQLIFISHKIYQKFDIKAIDQHESLTFLWKNYHKKPSDVAMVLIILFVIVLLHIDGLNVVKILLCYILPICIMILRFSQVIGYQKDRKRLQKNQSILLVNSNIESQKQQQSNKTAPNKDIKLKHIREQMPTMKDLNQQFIFYFVLNLVLDLVEPLILLFIQNVFNLLELIFRSILGLILEGDYWQLILVPFKFIWSFIAHLVTFSEISQQAIVMLIFLRIILSAVLLNMNQEKRNYCQKLLFQGKILSVFSKNQQQNTRPKTQ